MNEQPELPLQEAVVGNWQVVYQKLKSTNFTFEDRHEGVVTKWGCYYILSLKINSDGTYEVNNSAVGSTTFADSLSLNGRWWMDNQGYVTFSCDAETLILFRAHINKGGMLVLENDDMILRHNKIE